MTKMRSIRAVAASALVLAMAFGASKDASARCTPGMRCIGARPAAAEWADTLSRLMLENRVQKFAPGDDGSHYVTRDNVTTKIKTVTDAGSSQDARRKELGFRLQEDAVLRSGKTDNPVINASKDFWENRDHNLTMGPDKKPYIDGVTMRDGRKGQVSLTSGDEKNRTLRVDLDAKNGVVTIKGKNADGTEDDVELKDGKARVQQ
ncbi:MAG: hypothetical protein HY059_22245 [Proteobacteria bacterium]|nr:hypothetical protein [Pseudomonadota bacterium]